MDVPAATCAPARRLVVFTAAPSSLPRPRPRLPCAPCGGAPAPRHRRLGTSSRAGPKSAAANAVAAESPMLTVTAIRTCRSSGKSAAGPAPVAVARGEARAGVLVPTPAARGWRGDVQLSLTPSKHVQLSVLPLVVGQIGPKWPSPKAKSSNSGRFSADFPGGCMSLGTPHIPQAFDSTAETRMEWA